MISWTISHPSPITGSTQRFSTSKSESSASYSTSITGSSSSGQTAGLSLSSGSGSNTSGQSYAETASTTWGESGTTTFRSTSSSVTFLSTSTVKYLDYAGTSAGGGNGDSFSSSTSGSSSGKTEPTFLAHTSTTRTLSPLLATTFSTSEDTDNETFVWTTRTTSTNSEQTQSIEFLPTAVPLTVYGIVEEPVERTTVSTTTLPQTVTAAASATVIQADTNEIIYVITNPATQWNQYLAATSVAQSGTRFTIQPQWFTTSFAAGAALPTASTTSSTGSNESVVYSLSWKRSTTARETITRVSFTRVPNITSTATRTAITTVSSSASGVLFASSTFVFGRVGSVTSSSASTTQIASYAKRPTTINRQFGTLSFESTTETTASTMRTVTYSLGATSSFSTENSNQLGDTYSGTSNGSTFLLSNNQTILGQAQITTGVGGELSRSRFATSGIIVGDSTGAFITAAAATITDLFLTARDGSGRFGATIFPRTNNTVTIDGNLATYITSTSRATDETNTNSTESTKKEITMSVEGSSYTITESVAGRAGPFINGGGEIGRGCTVVDVAQAGAYKDQINGQVTSFTGAATVLTEGESQLLRAWKPVTFIGPLENRTNRNPVTFLALRNRFDLPP